MGLLRNGAAGASVDNLLLAAKQFGVDYSAANDYLDSTFVLIHDQWSSLAKDLGEKPLAPPAFKLPARCERMLEPVWRKMRG